MKVIVIGGGPSGIISAIEASKKHEVILLDANNALGKKLLLTGNGRCNYWNSNININKYITNDKDILSNILTEDNKIKTLEYLNSLGIYPKIINDLYYPYSNTATSIHAILLNHLNKNNVKIINNFKVVDIIKDNDKFKIKGNDNLYIEGDKLIIATGGITVPKTGSDGSIYEILKRLNHNVLELKPSLTRIKLKSNNLPENVRAQGMVSVICDNNVIFSETGEIHFNKNEISGIVSFNASAFISSNILSKSLYVELDLMPDISDLYSWLNDRNILLNNPTLENMLESIFNYKLMFYLFDVANINKNRTWDSLLENEKKDLINAIKKIRIEVYGVDDFNNAQVTIGGIPLTEIDYSTFESKIVSNLFIVGETLDVAGLCGGYNLAFAFISGLLAGGAV